MAMNLIDRLSLQPGQIVHVRARIVEHFGSDMQIEIDDPTKSTKLLVSSSQLVGCEPIERTNSEIQPARQAAA